MLRYCQLCGALLPQDFFCTEGYMYFDCSKCAKTSRFPENEIPEDPQIEELKKKLNSLRDKINANT